MRRRHPTGRTGIRRRDRRAAPTTPDDRLGQLPVRRTRPVRIAGAPADQRGRRLRVLLNSTSGRGSTATRPIIRVRISNASSRLRSAFRPPPPTRLQSHGASLRAREKPRGAAAHRRYGLGHGVHGPYRRRCEGRHSRREPPASTRSAVSISRASGASVRPTSRSPNRSTRQV